MINALSGIEKKIIEAEQLCEVFLLYFDEVLGHIPILSSPEDIMKDNEETMHLLRIHSIWFLDISNKTSLDRVDLEYGEKMYFAKKFTVPSNRIKRRAGSEKKEFETIVLILALPVEMDIFGGALLKKMTERIIKHCKSYLSQLIESEIAKLDLIKTQKCKKSIKKGDALKKRIKALIKNTCSQYFQSVIKKTDITTLKIQKAISYLSLKGIPISYIVNENKEIGFSNIKLFIPHIKNKPEFKIEKLFNVVYSNLLNKRQELEIIVKNQSLNEFKNLYVKVISIQEFFEQTILYEKIDEWFPDEELVFIFPDLSVDHEYIVYIIYEDKKKILFQKIIKT